MTRLEVIQQRLRVGGGVLEEAEDGDEHLHDLKGGEVRDGAVVGALSAALHVLNTHRDTSLRF